MTDSTPRAHLVEVALFASLSLSACATDGPVQPSAPEVDLVVVSGSGQFAPAGQQLIDPLTVSVRRRDDGRMVEGVVVEWAVVGGAGAQLSSLASQSDFTRLATVTFRLGTELGQYSVEARIRDQPERFVAFEGWAVLPPQLTDLSAASAEAGQVITIEGSNFSTIPAHNVVLFSGIRGSVVSAESTRLSVTVPGLFAKPWCGRVGAAGRPDKRFPAPERRGRIRRVGSDRRASDDGDHWGQPVLYVSR